MKVVSGERLKVKTAFNKCNFSEVTTCTCIIHHCCDMNIFISTLSTAFFKEKKKQTQISNYK